MRVLHVGQVCGHGGTETILATLIRQQIQEGAYAEIFYFEDQGGAAHYEGLCRVTFANRTSLAETLLRGHFDVLHCITYAAAGAGRAVRRSLYRGSIIVTSHGCGAYEQHLAADRVVAVSNAVAHSIQHYYPQPVEVVYNGIDTSVFYPDDTTRHHTPVIAWIGRVSDVIKDFVGVLALAHELPEGFEFVVVDGSSEAVDSTMWLPRSMRVLKNKPWREMPDFYRWVAASRGFVLSTSRSEACPVNILEAQACGCPVIAPAVGGIPEIVDHQVTGYVYDRKLGVEGIRQGMDWLYSGDQHERASRAAAEYIAVNFTAEKMSREYAAIYEKAMAAHHPGPLNRAAQRVLLSGVSAARKLKQRRRRSEVASE